MGNLTTQKLPQVSKIFKLNGRYFGKLENSVFYRSVKLSKHLFRSLDSWSVDEWLFKELEESGCRRLLFEEKEEAKEYSISLSVFKINAQKIDFGYGTQLTCPRKFWEVEQRPHQLTLLEQ